MTRLGLQLLCRTNFLKPIIVAPMRIELEYNLVLHTF